MEEHGERKDERQPEVQQSSAAEAPLADLDPEILKIVVDQLQRRAQIELTPNEELAVAIVEAIGVVPGKYPADLKLDFHEKRRRKRLREPGVKRAIQIAIRAAQIARAFAEMEPDSAEWKDLEEELERLYLGAAFHRHEGNMARRMIIWDAIEGFMPPIRRASVVRAVARKSLGLTLSVPRAPCGVDAREISSRLGRPQPDRAARAPACRCEWGRLLRERSSRLRARPGVVGNGACAGRGP